MTVAQLFLDNIFKLHGLPETIVSDKDKVFVSTFWQELFKKVGTKLQFSPAYHPETNGQTKVLNRCLDGYLRCMTRERPHDWGKWLSLVEWWYNSNFHTTICTTPYEALYGQPPPFHLPYLAGSSAVAVVDRSLQHREAAIKLLKFHLRRAQDRMKQQSDNHRSDREFEEGSWVYLKLQPYRQHTVTRVLN